MCILILRVAIAKILSVASSLHAYRERVGGFCDRGRVGVRGGDRGVREGCSRTGGGDRGVPATDFADTPPAQGKPRCITLILNNHWKYIYDVHLCYRIYIETTCIDKPTYEFYLHMSSSCYA